MSFLGVAVILVIDKIKSIVNDHKKNTKIEMNTEYTAFADQTDDNTIFLTSNPDLCMKLQSLY
jgi:hypothetical protein